MDNELREYLEGMKAELRDEIRASEKRTVALVIEVKESPLTCDASRMVKMTITKQSADYRGAFFPHALWVPCPRRRV